ncbi:hypothetical protein RIF29_30389 [Crotalaria pallida]|uniref:Replication protein A 70 kDa DNA-binding subunit B/D first OB fold domain-containing protein n=1 Tax=Crotalaria pallida TaxID=3830 RepID=A0AAN9HWN2_CROPI
MHMVSMDLCGDEIHASIYGPAVPFFSRYLHEGSVYDFASFQVVKAEGGFRLTSHPFKLVFLFSTLFERASSILFPVWKLDLNSVDKISSCKDKIYHLQGRVVCSTVMYVSKLLVNPDMPDIIEFRKRMFLHGFCRSPPIVSYIGSNSSIENQLMGDFPHVSLGILKSVAKPGYYTVLCTVVGISSTVKWYYLECSCKAIVYYVSYQSSCSLCGASVSDATQRFMIPLVCYDSTATITMFLLDRDARMLLKHSCVELFSLPSNSSQVEVSHVSPESNEMVFYITRVGHDIVNLKSIAPTDESTTPELVRNADVIVSKGKSAFVACSSNIRKTHVKRNLNKDYEGMFTPETSKSSKSPVTKLNDPAGCSNGLDLKKTVATSYDESTSGSHNAQ